MSSSHQPRALAVARDRITLNVIVSLLQANGYEVDGASSGTDAVRRLGEASYGAVVATFGAPPINGYGLWSFMQGSARLADIPFVLALTLQEQQRLFMEGREMPASLLIPFTADGLRGALDRSRSGAPVDVFEI